ncbi:MAG: hypothetical protein ACM3L9_07875, partial [Deltaproteobacteria bacterium]
CSAASFGAAGSPLAAGAGPGDATSPAAAGFTSPVEVAGTDAAGCCPAGTSVDGSARTGTEAIDTVKPAARARENKRCIGPGSCYAEYYPGRVENGDLAKTFLREV